MSRSVLLISCEPLGSRLKEHIERQYQKTVDCLNLPRRFFDRQPVTDLNEYIRYYEEICRNLEAQSPASLRNYLAIVPVWADEMRSDNWNPLLNYEKTRDRPYPPEVLLSWLMLTYPEIRWVFLSDSAKGKAEATHKFHSLGPDLDLAKIFTATSCIPLFDPCGLRNSVRRVMGKLQDIEGHPIASAIPGREFLAAAVDEEVNYAYMNAYTAYRFGYRAWVINTWEMLNAVFSDQDSKEDMDIVFGSKITEGAGNGAHHQVQKEDVDIVFEDLYLNFPDRSLDYSTEAPEYPPDQRHLSNLAFRDSLLNVFQRVRKRVLVTVGHRRTRDDRERWLKNKAYLNLLPAKVKILFKPFAGIFDLWERSGLWRRFENLPQLAPGFSWPPDKKEAFIKGSTHSAPGKLLIIAQRLIKRTRKILDKVDTVPDAIHAAILALEAKELLSGKTPATALEALALQHQAEIVAESMFYGIEYNLNVKGRFRDIQKEVEAIGYWFNPKSAQKSKLNARLTIIADLAHKFRDLKQFEEEQECLAEARRLRLDFWLRQTPIHWIAWPFIKYIDILMRSVGHFLLVVLFWIAFFTGIYWAADNGSAEILSFGQSLWEAFAASLAFFFTLQPVHGWDGNVLIFGSKNWWNIVLAFQGLVSFSNLGLLLTHFYMLISRK